MFHEKIYIYKLVFFFHNNYRLDARRSTNFCNKGDNFSIFFTTLHCTYIINLFKIQHNYWCVICMCTRNYNRLCTIRTVYYILPLKGNNIPPPLFSWVQNWTSVFNFSFRICSLRSQFIFPILVNYYTIFVINIISKVITEF
jgi:hypothetical protein